MSVRLEKMAPQGHQIQVMQPAFAGRKGEKMQRIPANGGGGGIRTHERVAPLAVFKTAAFDLSATPPAQVV